MAVKVTVYPKDAPAGQELTFDAVSQWSLVDNNSHGPSRNFGINPATFEGKALLINTSQTDAVLVDGVGS